MHRKFFTTIVLLFTILAISCSAANPNELVLSGTIEGDTVHAGSRIGGRIEAVFVDEGSRVSAGDILYSLETDVLEAEKERAGAAVAEVQAAYDVIAAGAKSEDIARARQETEALRQVYELALQGPQPEEIAALQSQADSLEAVWHNARDAVDRLSRLYEEGVAAEREWFAAIATADAAYNQWQAALNKLDAVSSLPREEEVNAARARYLAASSAVQSLEAGATDEQLAQADARITTTRETLDRIDIDLAESEVFAPSDGVISTFNLKPGDFVAPGQASCEIIDMTKLKVIVYIPENRLGFVTEGDKLPLTVDSFPGETFSGNVVNVAAEAEYTPRNVQVVDERISQVFAVEISVDNPDLRLRPGMAADVVVSLLK